MASYARREMTTQLSWATLPLSMITLRPFYLARYSWLGAEPHCTASESWADPVIRLSPAAGGEAYRTEVMSLHLTEAAHGLGGIGT